MTVWILWGTFFVLSFITMALLWYSLPMLEDNSHRFLEEHSRFVKLLSVFLSASVAVFLAAVLSSIWNLIFAQCGLQAFAAHAASMDDIMRNLVIERITELMVESPNLMNALDLSPDELQNLSNADLLEVLEEIIVAGMVL